MTGKKRGILLCQKEMKTMLFVCVRLYTNTPISIKLLFLEFFHHSITANVLLWSAVAFPVTRCLENPKGT
jgi:hypothetical protein